MNKLLSFSCKIFFLILLNFGCKKDVLKSESEYIINGKYAIISADSDKKIDVNFDGVKTSDLLKEIETLEESYLELIIRHDSHAYVFSQFWQNQYFSTSDGNIPTTYDPKAIVNYVNQATVSSFNFNQDRSKLILSRESVDESFPLPESVEILKNHDVRVKMEKSLYTSTGWQNVNVIVVYRKFSNEF